jgi:hypothetical protein
VSVVVSDASPLHYLIQSSAVHILPALFQQVLIPPVVFQELQHARTPPMVRAWVEHLPPWLIVRAPSVLDASLAVDEGEREAICLAREVQAAVLLMDDRKGRAEALRCGLRVTGTIGVLEGAAARGLVDFPHAMQQLWQTSARLDEELVQAALERHRRLEARRHPGLKP